MAETPTANADGKTNIWRMTAKDKDGKAVEGSPGKFAFILRGPEDIKTIRIHAQILLNAMRQRIFDNTEKDPGYVVDKIEPAGHSDQAVEGVGDWRPAGAEPVAMMAAKEHIEE